MWHLFLSDADATGNCDAPFDPCDKGIVDPTDRFDEKWWELLRWDNCDMSIFLWDKSSMGTLVLSLWVWNIVTCVGGTFRFSIASRGVSSDVDSRTDGIVLGFLDNWTLSSPNRLGLGLDKGVLHGIKMNLKKLAKIIFCKHWNFLCYH